MRTIRKILLTKLDQNELKMYYAESKKTNRKQAVATALKILQIYIVCVLLAFLGEYMGWMDTGGTAYVTAFLSGAGIVSLIDTYLTYIVETRKYAPPTDEELTEMMT